MDTEKMRAALAYLKKKKLELTVQQYRTIKGQIIAGDEDGAIRGIDRVVEGQRPKDREIPDPLHDTTEE